MISIRVFKEEKLFCGDEKIAKFIRQVYHIDDPVICVWTTYDEPDLQIKKTTGDEGTLTKKSLSIDFVEFFSRKQIKSLFFPLGFQIDKWNLVLISFVDFCNNTEEEIQTIRGWMMGINIQNMTINYDILNK